MFFIVSIVKAQSLGILFMLIREIGKLMRFLAKLLPNAGSKNIGYLIWAEDLENPIIKSQVFELLKRVSNYLEKHIIYIISLQPIKKVILNRYEFRELREELERDNIHLLIIPIFYFRKKFMKDNWIQIPLIFFQALPIIIFLSVTKRIRLLHCRSYPVVYPSIIVKKILKNKLIFDPRSPFPEENVAAGRWRSKAFTYKVWKYLERKSLGRADITIAISSTYVNHFRRILATSKLIEIPNNVDTTKFRMRTEFRERLRLKLGIEEYEIVFVYTGSLGINHWNSLKVYIKFIKEMRRINIKHKFLFITPNLTELMHVFNEYDITPCEYVCISLDSEEVPLYLSCADFGLNLMDRPDIRVSIKTVEYLSMGLPIIVNSLGPLGAKKLVEDYNIGLIIDLDKFNLKELKAFIQKKAKLSSKCRQIAHKKFSTEKVAKQYAKVYLSLLE